MGDGIANNSKYDCWQIKTVYKTAPTVVGVVNKLDRRRVLLIT